MKRIPIALVLTLAGFQGAWAQEQMNHSQMSHEQMPKPPTPRENIQASSQEDASAATTNDNMQGMSHGSMRERGQSMGAMHGMAGMFGPYPMTREASGTSWQPDATPMAGIQGMNGP